MCPENHYKKPLTELA